MHIRADTLDDLLGAVFRGIRSRGLSVTGAQKGPFKEVFGAMLELRNPLARLSRTDSRGVVLSALGELIWYLSGSDRREQIEFYIDYYAQHYRGVERIPSAYGPRLISKSLNQLDAVVAKLQHRPASRNAVVVIANRRDFKKLSGDAPCTIAWQFVVRRNVLNMMVFMRSNDAWLGLPHDVFCFTMIQEIVARRLGLEIGVYKHSVGSLHLYDCNSVAVERFLEEGWQEPMPMPRMPDAAVLGSVDRVLRCEKLIRNAKFNVSELRTLDPYWRDIVVLLALQGADRKESPRLFSKLQNRLSNWDVYGSLVAKRRRRLEKQVRPVQTKMDLWKS